MGRVHVRDEFSGLLSENGNTKSIALLFGVKDDENVIITSIIIDTN